MIARDRLHKYISTVRAACASIAIALAGRASAQIQLPPGYTATAISPVFIEPTAMAFAPDGRLFVAEKRGVVKVVQNGATISTFIDLQNEVNAQGDRGLLGIALEPDYLTGRHLWLLLTVDPTPGPPDEPATTPVFGRLLRYQGTSASGGNIAGANSRVVLLGNTASDGIPDCWTSHAIGTVRVAGDGSLFVGTGDGAHYEFADGGGLTFSCLFDGIIDLPQDIGAFRSQSLNSLDGKILRIDGLTGNGLPDNPFWTGNAQDMASRVWASGVRNPFRFNVKPGTSPGTLFIGDVGWDNFEELSVSSPQGGNNFGWPCFEGFADSPDYPGMNPDSSDCGTIGTPENPGSLTAPIVSWHHSNPDLSIPQGFTGNAAAGGVFSSGSTYPVPFRNGFFFADVIAGWIKIVKTDAADQVTAVIDFASSASQPVDFAIDPLTGDLCYLSLQNGRVYRIHCTLKPADVNGNGIVNIDDLLAVINAWGPCTPPKGLQYCPADVTDDGNINIDDLLAVINGWG